MKVKEALEALDKNYKGNNILKTQGWDTAYHLLRSLEPISDIVEVGSMVVPEGTGDLHITVTIRDRIICYMCCGYYLEYEVAGDSSEVNQAVLRLQSGIIESESIPDGVVVVVKDYDVEGSGRELETDDFGSYFEHRFIH